MSCSESSSSKPRVLPLRGRLQHLMSRANKRVGAAAKSDRAPKRAAQAQGECGQERGGAAVAAEVSGLQPDVAPEAE